MPDFTNLIRSNGDIDLTRLPPAPTLRGLLTGPIAKLAAELAEVLTAAERAKLAGLVPSDDPAVSRAYRRFLSVRDDVARQIALPAPLLGLAIDLSDCYDSLGAALDDLTGFIERLISALVTGLRADNRKVLDEVRRRLAGPGDGEQQDRLETSFDGALNPPVKKQKAKKARRQAVGARGQKHGQQHRQAATTVEQLNQLHALEQAARDGYVPALPTRGIGPQHGKKGGKA